MRNLNLVFLSIAFLLAFFWVSVSYSQYYYAPQSSKLSLVSNIHSNLTLTINEQAKEMDDENSSSYAMSTIPVEFEETTGDLADQPDNSDTSEMDLKARRYLPEDMSWTENLLWGVHGWFTSEPLTASERKGELSLRRTMLTWHQGLGITTWVLMSATVLAGQLTLNGNTKYRSWHVPLADATIIGYGATALLAILSPPPLIRRSGEHDTVFFHKLLAYVHAVGMIALPFLANSIARRSFENGKRGPAEIDAARARAHQVAAYITYGAFTASILTIVF
jgi:hypothetical protein